MPEDVYGPTRDERRSAEHPEAELLGRTERARDRKRNPRWRPPSGHLLHDLEHTALRRILAAEHIATADASALERRAVTGRDVANVRVRPRMLRPDESGQPSPQMIRDQTADEVAFGERPRSIDNAGIHADHRTAVGDGTVGEPIGRNLRTLIIVRFERRRSPARRNRNERRGVQHARNLQRRRHRQYVPQPADVHIVEVRAPAAPDADERRGVGDRVAAGGRALERGAVADVPIDERARQSASRGAAREDHERMPARLKRRDGGATEVPRAARHEHLHCEWPRQYSRRSSSV